MNFRGAAHNGTFPDLDQLYLLFLNDDSDGTELFLRACARIARFIIRSIRVNTISLNEEDLVMEIIYLLFSDNKKVVRRFRGKSSFKTYFFVVCRRHILHIAQKENKRGDTSILIGDCDRIGLCQQHGEESVDVKVLLRKNLKKLERRERMFVDLYYYKDISHKDIIHYFGWKNANALYTFNRRILNKLK
ncbi:MAG: sigma-70 family RNA polymerase sigma factor [Chitinivibrionales bacterium]|nr:sigma-70 family RNA polymerase sigma factor [Chitinivibrionales bacterium]